MTESTTQTAPLKVCLDLLIKRIPPVKSSTPFQRQNIFENSIAEVPWNPQSTTALERLATDLYEDRGFHALSSLDYADPKKENLDIIRAALAWAISDAAGTSCDHCQKYRESYERPCIYF